MADNNDAMRAANRAVYVTLARQYLGTDERARANAEMLADLLTSSNDAIATASPDQVVNTAVNVLANVYLHTLIAASGAEPPPGIDLKPRTN